MEKSSIQIIKKIIALSINDESLYLDYDDFTERLIKKILLLRESFRLLDDISIALYGKKITFINNAFHQYCRGFVKPKK